jgi:3-vinyl bacteriochlorophyllide hydratase
MHNLLKDEKCTGEAHSAREGVGVVQGNLYGASKIDLGRLSRWLYISNDASSQKFGRGMIGRDPVNATAQHARALYTRDERRRRDASRWTLVQGVLAPLQFAVFLVSVCLVLRYLATGDGLTAATVSIVVKTFVLYTIMITGSLWEHDVYGRYLFAPAFFWEDVVSMLVLALHTAYLAALATAALGPREQMFLALAAYVSYVVNATQFLLKLRAARLGERLLAQQASNFASCAQ